MLPASLADQSPAVRSAAHLSDYPFRFGPASAAVAAATITPPAGADWTLGETLDEIRRRGVSLRLASSGLKVVHGHRMPDVVRHVARHADALTVWLRVGGDAGTTAAAPGWDAATRLHAAWLLERFTPPAGPLALAPGVTVTHWPVYREAVVHRLALGPDAAGAGALRATLSGLFDRFAGADARLSVADPGWAMAA